MKGDEVKLDFPDPHYGEQGNGALFLGPHFIGDLKRGIDSLPPKYQEAMLLRLDDHLMMKWRV